AHAAALRSDLTTMDGLAANLSTAATAYKSTDQANATAIGAVASTATGAPATGVTRFGGVQRPDLPEVADAAYTLRQTVTTAGTRLAPYDAPLSVALGGKPTEVYLTPLLADWEAIAVVGRRIGMLGINDYVAAQNIVNGTNWLNSEWSGNAAQAFTASASTL